MFLDGERPKYTVDAVRSFRIEIMQHEHVHHDIINEPASYFDPDRYRGCHEKERQRNQVSRIQTAEPTFPKRGESYFMRFPRSLHPGPLQVNAKTGDDEEKEDADITKRAERVNENYRPLQEVLWD